MSVIMMENDNEKSLDKFFDRYEQQTFGAAFFIIYLSETNQTAEYNQWLKKKMADARSYSEVMSLMRNIKEEDKQ